MEFASAEEFEDLGNELTNLLNQSLEAEPAQPEPVAERMSAAEDQSADQPGQAGTGAARTPEGEVVRDTDFYPPGLPGPKQDGS